MKKKSCGLQERDIIEMQVWCIVRPAYRDWAYQTEHCYTLSNKTCLQ